MRRERGRAEPGSQVFEVEDLVAPLAGASVMGIHEGDRPEEVPPSHTPPSQLSQGCRTFLVKAVAPYFTWVFPWWVQEVSATLPRS